MSIPALRATSYKHSTGLVGLAVNPNAREDAVDLYNKLLGELQVIPETAGYRVSVERTAKHRLSLIEQHNDQKKLEDELGFQLEEIIEDAKNELELLPSILEHKPWESTEEIQVQIKE